jgi:UDP-2,3-diacylglucosamine hydrolase
MKKPKGKIYFASDFHLGLKAGSDPSERERRVVKWLEKAAADAQAIYLLGDIFDFWWEYRLVVPKGFTRFLGAVSSITDSGIEVNYLTGNHDMWMGNYLSEECGVSVHHGVIRRQFDGRTFLLAHGEGLGSRERGYHLLLFLFRNRVIRKLFSAIHPRIGVAIGNYWSTKSRLGKGQHTPFLGEDKEDLLRFARKTAESDPADYYIFGHRHLPMKHELQNGGIVVMMGDWTEGNSWAVWDGRELEIKS